MSKSEKEWIPVDGDTLVTDDGFIFTVFGYEHPKNRTIAFLKYIPIEYKCLFDIKYLKRTWKYGDLKLFRAEQLYSADNYQAFIRAFKRSFPKYVYFSPFTNKEIISVPIEQVEKIYIPWKCLQTISRKKRKDNLQEMAKEFVDLLSEESHITKRDFGVSGSVALNMQSNESDLDIVVYGALNFRVLEKTVGRLVKEGILSYRFNNRLDTARRFRGIYRSRVFMYNAVRKMDEIDFRYGKLKYTVVHPIKFKAKVENDMEAMFRPAIYKITSFQASDLKSNVSRDQIPLVVISMIGCYRNAARQGDEISVSGILEKVEDLETNVTYHQVVVGSGFNEDEHIWSARFE